MTETTTLDTAHQHLAAAIQGHSPPAPHPLNISPYVAMSALQKAIRRGEENIALRAAATLLQSSPDRLWRRLCGIAFEDVGLADLNAVSLVMAALAGKRLRAQLGGEWYVASFIISAMARAPKCRAADDLLMSAELHPALASARREFSTLADDALCRIAITSPSLPERALALWYLLGTDPWSAPKLERRAGNPQAVFDLLRQTGFSTPVVELARFGHQKSRSALPVFVAMLSPLKIGPAEALDDVMPPERTHRDVPCWALDLYSREGQGALHQFTRGYSRTATWVRRHVPGQQRVPFLGGILFRVEGGLCRQRVRWRTADELRQLVDVESHGPCCSDAAEILELMRRDIPLLNEVRRHVG